MNGPAPAPPAVSAPFPDGYFVRAGWLMVTLIAFSLIGGTISTIVDRRVVTALQEEQSRLFKEAGAAFEALTQLDWVTDRVGTPATLETTSQTLNVYAGVASAWMQGKVRGPLVDAGVQANASVQDGLWSITSLTISYPVPLAGPVPVTMQYSWNGISYEVHQPSAASPIMKSKGLQDTGETIVDIVE